ncbi:hypothetical protein [Candidatus Sulfurimonas marisnigri]|uniref:hypothetical protein n=1 Tax=Candidatus Sulfurimonas marisnigri TaxID=2740405 RepID=UPI001E35C9F8|nr:hypothetical protein [Candidatus Sulfurimonas marisnigri]
MKLSLEDVLEITDEDNTIRIDGDNKDTVSIDTSDGDSEWTLGDHFVDSEGFTHMEYTSTDGNDTVSLEINTQIIIEES